MIIGKNRNAVIENIQKLLQEGNFNQKAELDDPIITAEQSKEITDWYVENRNRISFKIKTAVGIFVSKCATRVINKDTVIKGAELIPKDLGGAIITVNHFNPLENTVVRYMTQKIGKKRMGIISQTSNFAMSGIIGFIMKYGDTVPISVEPRYLARDFLSILKEKLIDKKQMILLYPEQEMWFNYRKPRPPKKGAYFYAAKLNVPIVSCFTEIKDTDEDDTEEFKKVKYVIHILEVLYPDKNKSVHENTEILAEKDYCLKKECYGKKLTYDFENSDIAGWKKV